MWQEKGMPVTSKHMPICVTRQQKKAVLPAADMEENQAVLSENTS
jgi:hypothetical protein